MMYINLVFKTIIRKERKKKNFGQKFSVKREHSQRSQLLMKLMLQLKKKSLQKNN